jgi:4-amino-4-deoxy-L-arabinose transferase-like glycosyltransferase
MLREVIAFAGPKDPAERKEIIGYGLAVFLFAALFRFCYVNTMVVYSYERADAALYVQLARNLVSHGVYSLEYSQPFSPANYITPGYPLFLSLILNLFPNFDNFVTVTLNLQALLGSLTALLLYVIALRMMSPCPAFIAGLLVALSPHLIVGSGYILTETLFTFFITFAMFLCIQACRGKSLGWMTGCGGIFGLSAMIRPAVLLYPFLLPLIFWKLFPQRRAVISGLLIVAGTTLLWSSWSAWKNTHPANAEVSQSAASFALGIYPNLIHHNPKLRGFPYNEDPEYNAMAQDMGTAVAALWARARNEPGRYLAWYLFGKPVTFWSPSVIAGEGGPFVHQVMLSIYSGNSLPAMVLAAMMALHGWLVVLAALNCCLAVLIYFGSARIEPNNAPLFLAALFLLYLTAIHTVLAPLPRYSFPGYPVVFLLAVHFAVTCRAFFKRRRERASQKVVVATS